MTTVTQTTTTRKPQAYYAHVYDEPGILAKVSGQFYFVTEADHRVMPFEPEMIPFCAILGACSIADTQAIYDRLAGGAAAIACNRLA